MQRSHKNRNMSRSQRHSAFQVVPTLAMYKRGCGQLQSQLPTSTYQSCPLAPLRALRLEQGERGNRLPKAESDKTPEDGATPRKQSRTDK
jgi:hypothetical protein